MLTPCNTGWTSDGKATHYLAIFASWTNDKNEPKRALLSVAPMGDETEFTAQAHKDAIEYILGTYGKGTDNLDFFTSDNCNTNKALSDLMATVMVGCASHRLNLASKSVYAAMEDVLKKIDSLMSSLRTLKGGGKLRKYFADNNLQEICPEKRNLTRWSSTYNMIKKVIDLEGALPNCGFDAEVLVDVPTALEMAQLKELLTTLSAFESVSKKLQEDNPTHVTLAGVRALFDQLIKDFP